jgi:hypothetical protein
MRRWRRVTGGRIERQRGHPRIGDREHDCSGRHVDARIGHRSHE